MKEYYQQSVQSNLCFNDQNNKNKLSFTCLKVKDDLHLSIGSDTKVLISLMLPCAPIISSVSSKFRFEFKGPYQLEMKFETLKRYENCYRIKILEIRNFC